MEESTLYYINYLFDNWLKTIWIRWVKNIKKEAIRLAALECFAKYGYDGTSLSKIAEVVGLKKQSLYSHFKDKDAIFMAVLQYAKEKELSMYADYFQQVNKNKVEETLHGFLVRLVEMFSEDVSQRFWLRMNFYPPLHLLERVKLELEDIYEAHEEILTSLFEDWYQQGLVDVKNSKSAMLAYQGLINTLLMDIIYLESRSIANERLEAMWNIFWRGIQPITKQE